MDDLRMPAWSDATAMVARDFEPTRIERQLLVRAFELLCEIQSSHHGSDQLVSKQSASAEFDRRRIA